MELSGTLRAARKLSVAILALCLAAPVFAFQPSGAGPDESDLDNHQSYTNRDGATVHAPAHSRSGRVPEGASAQCRDGTYSFSRHHRGTCSRHGGVAQWL